MDAGAIIGLCIAIFGLGAFTIVAIRSETKKALDSRNEARRSRERISRQMDIDRPKEAWEVRNDRARERALETKGKHEPAPSQSWFPKEPSYERGYPSTPQEHLRNMQWRWPRIVSELPVLTSEELLEDARRERGRSDESDLIVGSIEEIRRALEGELVADIDVRDCTSMKDWPQSRRYWIQCLNADKRTVRTHMLWRCEESFALVSESPSNRHNTGRSEISIGGLAQSSQPGETNLKRRSVEEVHLGLQRLIDQANKHSVDPNDMSSFHINVRGSQDLLALLREDERVIAGTYSLAGKWFFNVKRRSNDGALHEALVEQLKAAEHDAWRVYRAD